MNCMKINNSDLLLAGLGLCLGFIVTHPVELRHRRLLHMALIPALLVGMRLLIPDGRDVTTNVSGFMGFLVPMILLAVLLAPSLGWIVSGALVNVLDNPDNRPVHTLELHQVRRRIRSGLIEEAYQLLTRNLRSTKPTYEAMYLKAALEQEMGMTVRARRTVRQMGRFASHGTQKQFVAEVLRSLQEPESHRGTPVAHSPKDKNGLRRWTFVSGRSAKGSGNPPKVEKKQVVSVLSL